MTYLWVAFMITWIAVCCTWLAATEGDRHDESE